MIRDQKITKLAKKLLELSKDNGVVTESKVSEVLAGLQQMQHRHTLRSSRLSSTTFAVRSIASKPQSFQRLPS